jgi:ribosomal protein S6
MRGLRGGGRGSEGEKRLTGHVLGKFENKEKEIMESSVRKGRRCDPRLPSDRAGGGNDPSEQEIMKNYYKATYILNIDGKEDGVEEMTGVLKEAIESRGGSVKNTRKMDHRSFERAASKKTTAGYYLNVNFELESEQLKALEDHFKHDGRIFRQFYLKPKRHRRSRGLIVIRPPHHTKLTQRKHYGLV